MIEDIKKISRGRLCPVCGNKSLYRLKDKRVKCARCRFRFSPKKFDDDLNILRLFCDGHSAYKTAKKLAFSYNKVRKRYMRYRDEIDQFIHRKRILELLHRRKTKKPYKREKLPDIKSIKTKYLSDYSRIDRRYRPLYEKEAEFRYRYSGGTGIFLDLAEFYFDRLLDDLKSNLQIPPKNPRQ